MGAPGHDDTAALVGRDDLEEALRRLSDEVADPRGGLFGPGSRVWSVNREAVIFLGGGRAALLQLAHPFVAQAVAEHSVARQDVLGRFVRTFDHVFDMVYGDLPAALAAARAVHGLHRRVTGRLAESAGPFAAGTPYAANHAEALLWVHATLWDTSLLIHERIVGPLSATVKNEYYAETRRFAALFGIPAALLPADWPAFEAYVARMFASPVLTVTRAGRELAHDLLRPPGSLLGPMWDWYAAVTAALLPERLRAEFELPFGWWEQRLAEATLGTLRTGWWMLPDRLRWASVYANAERRVAGRGPDLLGRLSAFVWNTALGGRTLRNDAGGREDRRPPRSSSAP